ncbi:hypothetical protein BH18ACT7_BH18ACT7_18240 [soil metagenome]
MSKPALGPGSTVSSPVAASVPLLAGDWMASWFRLVSTAYSLVDVLVSMSLFVYADPVMPVAGVVAGG